MKELSTWLTGTPLGVILLSVIGTYIVLLLGKAWDRLSGTAKKKFTTDYGLTIRALSDQTGRVLLAYCLSEFCKAAQHAGMIAAYVALIEFAPWAKPNTLAGWSVIYWLPVGTYLLYLFIRINWALAKVSILSDYILFPDNIPDGMKILLSSTGTSPATMATHKGRPSPD